MQKIQTPYYIIEQEKLDDNFKYLCSVLDEKWKNYTIGYSYKTNSLPWIIKHFQDMGCYAEVVSSDEYELSKLLETPKGKVIYNGQVKSKKSFIDAVMSGCIVNIDSTRELEWIVEIIKESRVNYNVGLRVNFDIEKYCPNQSACGKDGGRFGFCYENGELEKAIEYLLKNNVKLSGLHLHTSSKTREVCIYDAISRMAVKIAKAYGLDLEYVDIGGGFFGGMKSKPSFEKYFEVVRNNFLMYFVPEKTKLIIEPGMAIIGAFMKYVTTVIDIKDTCYNRFLVTDGSRTNIDPLMTKSNYIFEIKHYKQSNKVLKRQVISGFTCMENDRLLTLDNIEEISVGDEIIYNNVGAYTMSLTPLFISYYPDVYLKSKGNFVKVRNAWKADDVL